MWLDRGGFLTPERMLDTISRAGGTAGPGPDEWVMLERDGRRALIWAATWGALGREPFTPTTTQWSLKTSSLFRRQSLAAVSSAASTSGTTWFSVSRAPGRAQ